MLPISPPTPAVPSPVNPAPYPTTAQNSTVFWEAPSTNAKNAVEHSDEVITTSVQDRLAKLREQEATVEAEKQYRLKAGNLGIYTEVSVWTLRGTVAASRFQKVMQMIVDDDRQAEAYFQVFKLPKEHGVRLNPAELELESIDLLDQQFLVVAIGSCDQLVELHQLYDIRAMINGFSGHMENKARLASASINENIRQFSSRIYCLRASREINAIVDEWCSYPNFHIALCETVQATAPGGWYVAAPLRLQVSQPQLEMKC